MNAKHYVSIEVARLLKEKGYDRECISYYHDNCTEVDYSFCGERNSTWEERCVSAPTLLEAMDWLEERGIYAEIRLSSLKIKGVPMVISPDDEYEYKYFFVIVTRNSVTGIFEDGEDECLVTYSDKNECMNAFIKKGLELL